MRKGFNHNVRYRERFFHVQTEDSGARNKHVVTHLFDGGDILVTRKIDYRMIAGKPMYEQQVQMMMEEQHKTVIKALVRGEMDGIIEAHDRALPQQPRRSSPPFNAVSGPEQAAERGRRTTLREYLKAERTLDDLILRYLLDLESGVR